MSDLVRSMVDWRLSYDFTDFFVHEVRRTGAHQALEARQRPPRGPRNPGSLWGRSNIAK